MRIGIRSGRAGALLNISGQAREVGVRPDPELQLTQMEMPSQCGTPPANQASLQIGMWPGQAGALPKPLLIQAARAILRMSRLHVTRMEMPSAVGIIIGANFTQTGM